MFPEIGCVFCGRSGMNGARTASISVREPTRSTNRRLSRILTTIGCVRFGKIQTPRYAETGRISLGTTTKLTVRNHPCRSEAKPQKIQQFKNDFTIPF
jgi:hypothetical protein